jgi:hypothetical protein
VGSIIITIVAIIKASEDARRAANLLAIHCSDLHIFAFFADGFFSSCFDCRLHHGVCCLFGGEEATGRTPRTVYSGNKLTVQQTRAMTVFRAVCFLFHPVMQSIGWPIGFSKS